MSPSWVGPSKRMVYNMSQDQGETFEPQTRLVLFGTYFFVGEERISISRKVFTVLDLFANVGGILSFFNVVVRLVARQVTADILVGTIAETIYYTTRGKEKFNKVAMTY